MGALRKCQACLRATSGALMKVCFLAAAVDGWCAGSTERARELLQLGRKESV